MASTIVTKNSSTASAVPVSGDLTQGELAVNVTDKKLYTKDNGGSVVKIVGSLGNQESSSVTVSGGAINGTTVGAVTPSTGAFTTLSASGAFSLSGDQVQLTEGGTGASSASGARTNLGLVIGTDVQAYNANNAVTNTAQTFTVSQRGTVTTDNDLSFDMNVTNNFKCTPTATGALTFTNITAGQSGYVLLVNSGGYAITAAATTKVGATFLSTVSAAGTYLISYFTDGTNVYCTASGALS